MQRRRDQMRKRMSTTFDRAVNDPQFRQQLLDDPKLALNSSGDANAPRIPVKAQEQRRQLLEQVIDRAQNDPQFREHLKQEPQRLCGMPALALPSNNSVQNCPKRKFAPTPRAGGAGNGFGPGWSIRGALVAGQVAPVVGASRSRASMLCDKPGSNISLSRLRC
jgi:hypothetical protein